MGPSYALLSILLPGAMMLHVTEEFLFPGGFIEWYNKLIPSKTAKPVRYGYLVWINALMIGACVLPFYYGETKSGIAVWYCVAAIAGVNALFHIWGVFKLKTYSPGVITGTLLYIPLFVIGTIAFITSEILSVRRAIFIVAIAIGYHIFSVYRQRK